MFGQNRNKFWLSNNRISSLPSVAGTTLRAHFASLKSCTHKLALYAGCYVQKDSVRIYLIFIAIFLTACAGTGNSEYAKFRIGPDQFGSSENTFERSLCVEDDEKMKISLHLNQSEKAQLVALAKLDIADGNSDSGDLEKICVGSFPYEITVGVRGKTSSTTCFSPLRDDESRVANFVYSLESVQKLPKSQCRFY